MKFTGAVESPYDPRTYDFDMLAGEVSLPESAKYSVPDVGIYMQAQIPDCVNEAVYKGGEIVNFKELGRHVRLSPRGGHAVCMKKTRLPLGSGMYPRVAMDFAREGLFLEEDIPHNTNISEAEYINWTPTAEQKQRASLYKIDGYAQVDCNEQSIKKAIYYATQSRNFVIALMRVGNTYWIAPDGSTTWNKDKILPIQRPKQITSGHEILFDEYFYKNGRLCIGFINSWSSDWADNGRGWFYFDEHQDLIPEILVGYDSKSLIEVFPVFTYNFKNNLKKGDRGQDVVALQKALARFGFFKVTATGYYGDVTAQAVTAFQEAYADEVLKPFGLKKGTGYFGYYSRQKMNNLLK